MSERFQSEQVKTHLYQLKLSELVIDNHAIKREVLRQLSGTIQRLKEGSVLSKFASYSMEDRDTVFGMTEMFNELTKL